jgi:hypothetical protein
VRCIIPNPDAVKECYGCGKPWDVVKRATSKRRNKVVRLRRCVECHLKYQRAASQRYRDMMKAGHKPLIKRQHRPKDSQLLGDEYSAVEQRIQEYRECVEKAQINRRTGEAKNDVPLNHRPIW